MRLRKHKFECYLDEKENRLLEDKAAQAGLSKSAYFRKMLLGQEIKSLPPMDLYDVLKELRQINNNINQIAAKANSIGFIDHGQYRKDSEALSDAIGRLMKEVFG